MMKTYACLDMRTIVAGEKFTSPLSLLIRVTLGIRFIKSHYYR